MLQAIEANTNIANKQILFVLTFICLAIEIVVVCRCRFAHVRIDHSCTLFIEITYRSGEVTVELHPSHMAWEQCFDRSDTIALLAKKFDKWLWTVMSPERKRGTENTTYRWRVCTWERASVRQQKMPRDTDRMPDAALSVIKRRSHILIHIG